MPPKSSNNKTIKDFFKPFTIPRNRIPRNDVIEEEIIVASPKKPSGPSDDSSSSLASVNPRKRGRPRNDSSQTSNASTPTKRSPNRSPVKANSMPQYDGTADGASLVHISPASAERREMKAVEIKAPPPPPFKREAREHSAATSFSSLSSVPLSSQSSSKRIVKHGMYAVTNSDSGTDDSQSSDELADISTFVSPKRRKLTPPPQNVDHAMDVESTAKPKRRSTRIPDESTRSSTRANTPKFAPRPPSDKIYRHSLSNMIKQRQRLEKSEAKIQQAEAAFEETRKRREEELREEDGLEGALQAAVADDSDEGERMKLAIARTEALQDEQKFYFFRGVLEQPDAKPFPAKPGTIWETYRKNTDSRTQAFLSGFIAHLAEQSDNLPNETLEWIVDQLMRETREDLCEAYVEVLRVYSARHQDTALERNFLGNFYRTLDLDKQNPTTVGSSSPLHSMPSQLSDVPPRLSQVVEVIRDANYHSQRMPGALSTSVYGLLPALIDNHVASDIALQTQIQDAIKDILESISEQSAYERLSGHVCQGFFSQSRLSLQMRCQMITSLPASSERSHRLRRTLAINLLVNRCRNLEDFTPEVDSPTWAETILARLKSDPEFAVLESTNYALLEALVSVLDIAIDAGFSDFSFRSRVTGKLKPMGSLGKTSPAALAEASFNAQIDALVAQLRLMSSRIRDAGTTHLRRTEAKSAIDRLVLRLEYCVRTKPKQKTGVFGNVTGQQREFLSGFLKKNGVDGLDDTYEEGDVATVVPVELLSDSRVEMDDECSDSSTLAGAAVNAD